MVITDKDGTDIHCDSVPVVHLTLATITA